MKYIVRLSFRMLAAMVDIDAGHTYDDSPRWDGRTIAALQARGLIIVPSGALRPFLARTHLTPKGAVYLHVALYEYNRAGGLRARAA